MFSSENSYSWPNMFITQCFVNMVVVVVVVVVVIVPFFKKTLSFSHKEQEAQRRGPGPPAHIPLTYFLCSSSFMYPQSVNNQSGILFKKVTVLLYERPGTAALVPTKANQ